MSPNPETPVDGGGPFAIGQDIWPGIGKLMEEAAEVIQVCAKLIATGGNTNYWGSRDLRVWMEEEIADLRAAINFVIANNPELDLEAIHDRQFMKQERFEGWHRGAPV